MYTRQLLKINDMLFCILKPHTWYTAATNGMSLFIDNSFSLSICVGAHTTLHSIFTGFVNCMGSVYCWPAHDGQQHSFFCRSLLREGHLVVGCGEMVFKGGQALEGVADIVWVFGCVLCGGF